MGNNIKLNIIPTDKNYQILDIFLDDDGIANTNELTNLNLPQNTNPMKGIVLYGRGPIWLYSYITHLCHPFPFVAVFDPRIGAIVVENHVKNSLKIGDIIKSDEILNNIVAKNEIKTKEYEPSIKDYKAIALIGPPHSGKSILLDLIRKQIKGYIDNDFIQKYFYILRACPDGEGNWSNETQQQYVKILRYKNKFNDDFVNNILQHLSNITKTKKIVLVDCGGIIDKYNQRIWNLCTHAIIVSSDKSLITEWRGAAKASALEILAEIESTLEYKIDIIDTSDILKISLGPLEREKNDITLPEIFLKSII